MAQAASILQQQMRMNMAVVTLARQRARREVKLALQRQGRRKLNGFAARELTILADAYLAEHQAELINEAKEIVER
jgi:hypothetical protein